LEAVGLGFAVEEVWGRALDAAVDVEVVAGAEEVVEAPVRDLVVVVVVVLAADAAGFLLLAVDEVP
jgi:hypothetical protein